MPIRVVLLTQWFDPEPTFKGMTFARELLKKGFEVEVVTGFPNYPGGNVYPGYRIRRIQREMIDGVEITRLPLYPSHDGSVFRRVLNYISFAASSLFYGLFFMQRAEVIYAYHPPLTVGVCAAFLRLFRRIPVVYDIQDMWPDTLRATGMLDSERILKVIAATCQWVYRKVDRITVLSPGFKRHLISCGIPEQKIDVIYNWCDESSLQHASENLPKEFPGSDRFRIVFAGNMGKAQALGAVVEAAEILAEKCPEACFIFVGSGIEVDSLKRSVKEKDLRNVIFFPRVPMNEVGAVLAAADVLLVHLKDDPLFEITIPSKTQAYMAIGKPILMAVRGDAATLVEDASCGVTAFPENPHSLADAVLRLFSTDTNSRAAMAANSKYYYEQQLSLNVGAERFANHFYELARKRS